MNYDDVHSQITRPYIISNISYGIFYKKKTL